MSATLDVPNEAHVSWRLRCSRFFTAQRFSRKREREQRKKRYKSDFLNLYENVSKNAIEMYNSGKSVQPTIVVHCSIEWSRTIR